MTPLKDLRIAQTLNLRLRKFTYIIASPAAVPATRLFEAELGHDGSEASAIGILLEVADGADLGGDFCQGEEFRSCLLEAGGGVAEGMSSSSLEWIMKPSTWVSSAWMSLRSNQ